jgi:hypothetical protein
MAQKIERDLIGGREKSIRRFCDRTFGVLLLSESVSATPGQMGVRIAQQPTAPEQEATCAAAERALQEGLQLFSRNDQRVRR